MKTGRTRILIVVIAASIVVSIFTDWDALEQGYWDGYQSRNGSPVETSTHAR